MVTSVRALFIRRQIHEGEAHRLYGFDVQGSCARARKESVCVAGRWPTALPPSFGDSYLGLNLDLRGKMPFLPAERAVFSAHPYAGATMAPKDPKVAMLAAIPLFANCGGRELEQIAQLIDEVDVPAGKVLMRQGDHGDEMFIIGSGSVDIVRNDRLIKQRGAGHTIGEIALLSEGPRTATVTVTEPAHLFVLGHRQFNSLMDGHPGIRLQILSGLADRIRLLEADSAH